MAKHTYEQVMRWVVVSEGGWVNDPDDAGGETNYGVTHKTYDAWRKSQGLHTRSVKQITQTEVARIYKANYADMVRYDELPAGVDYAVLDFAINSGVSRAVKFVQRIVGTQQDGIMGSKTLSAVDAYDAQKLITELCEARWTFMKRLREWDTFGRGWTRRVMGNEIGTQRDDIGVIDRALMLADAKVERQEIPTPKHAPGKAHGEEKLSATVQETLKNPTALGAIVAQAGGLLTALSGDSPVHWALAALILVGGLALIVKLVRGAKG